MDSTQFLAQEWSVIQTDPALFVILIGVGCITAWWIRSRISRGKINALTSEMEAREERKVLVEERLSAVLRNEEMLKMQLNALQEQFQIVESQVLRQSHVPALIAATGSSSSTITNIALTADALSGSLNILRHGIGGANPWLRSLPTPEKRRPTTTAVEMVERIEPEVKSPILSDKVLPEKVLSSQ